jgi:hypothetical protein
MRHVLHVQSSVAAVARMRLQSVHTVVAVRRTAVQSCRRHGAYIPQQAVLLCCSFLN